MDEKLRERLLSEHIDLQSHAVREAVALVDKVLQSAVQGITVSQHPLLTCEALFEFGPAINKYLEQQIKQERSQKVKLAISLLLLRLNSKEGLDYVTGELRNGGELQYFAASALASAGICSSGPDILERLRILTQTSRFCREEAPKFNTLLNALKKLQIVLPDGIRRDLTAESIPEEISAAVRLMQ